MRKIWIFGTFITDQISLRGRYTYPSRIVIHRSPGYSHLTHNRTNLVVGVAGKSALLYFRKFILIHSWTDYAWCRSTCALESYLSAAHKQTNKQRDNLLFHWTDAGLTVMNVCLRSTSFKTEDWIGKTCFMQYPTCWVAWITFVTLTIVTGALRAARAVGERDSLTLQFVSAHCFD